MSGALNLDHRSPQEIEERVVALAHTKLSQPALKRLVYSVLAGMFVSFGALFFAIVSSDTQLSFAISKLLGGMSFCLGLILIVTCGAELFTGDMLMVNAVLKKQSSLKKTLLLWAQVWFGNMLGAFLALGLILAAHIPDLNGGAVAQSFITIASAKTSLDIPTLFFRGILCNLFVCLAVWVSYGARSTVDKIVGVLFPITAFVVCGFEHCIANMFFLPTGFIVALQDQTVSIEFLGIINNLLWVTAGNIVGGAVFVGAFYCYVFSSKKSSS